MVSVPLKATKRSPHCREIAPAADNAGDEATLDILTQRLNYHEKTAWMLRSLLEE